MSRHNRERRRIRKLMAKDHVRTFTRIEMIRVSKHGKRKLKRLGL